MIRICKQHAISRANASSEIFGFTLILVVSLLAAVDINQSVRAEEVISSEKLIQKLSVPPRTRGLVKTTAPGIGNSHLSPDPGMAIGSVMLNIQFAHDSNLLSSASQVQLNELGKALNSQQLLPFHFEIAGHTDAVGDREYNRRLSVRRAEAVRDYLNANLGVIQDRLRTVGWGQDRPLIPEDPYNPGNRRVEIVNLGR